MSWGSACLQGLQVRGIQRSDQAWKGLAQRVEGLGFKGYLRFGKRPYIPDQHLEEYYITVWRSRGCLVLTVLEARVRMIDKRQDLHLHPSRTERVSSTLNPKP